MSKYQVNTRVGEQEWQLINQARNYKFICDTVKKNAGPNPVEYLTGAVNSCIAMSAAMIIKSHKLDVKDFQVKTTTVTEDLGHGKSDVAAMKIRISFESSMSNEEKEKFLDHVLHVSTVYQTVQKEVMMDVKLA